MFNEAETEAEGNARRANDAASSKVRRNATKAGTAKKLSYIGCIFGDIMRIT